MTKKLGAQIVIVLAIILAILNIYQIDLNSWEESRGAVSGLISNVLLIIAMILSIRSINRSENKV